MTELTPCPTCGNPLLAGVTCGRLRCPACSRVLPIGTFLPPVVRRRNPGWTGGRLFAALAAVVSAAALLLVTFGRPLLRSAGLLAPDGNGLPTGMRATSPDNVSDPASMLAMFQQYHYMTQMRDYLVGMDASARKDSGDFAVQMQLMEGWQLWWNNWAQGGNHSPNGETPRSYSDMVIGAYFRSSASPHTREDQTRLNAAFRWLVRMPGYHSPPAPGAPTIGAASSGAFPQTLGKYLRGTHPVSINKGLAPGPQERPAPPRSAASLLDLGSGADHGPESPSMLKSVLLDSYAIIQKAPGDSYGWRRHAEALMDLAQIAAGSAGESQPMDGLFHEAMQELETARDLDHCPAARAMTLRDYQRLTRLYNVGGAGI